MLQNMKQKIVIQVQICCDKCRSKALKIVAVADGVISVALEGDDKNKVVVIGEGVDATCLVHCLRKKFNCVSLLTVEQVKPKEPEKGKDEKKEKKDDKPTPTPTSTPTPPICSYPRHCELYAVVYDPAPPTCIIM